MRPLVIGRDPWELEAIARSLCQWPVLDISPFGAFPYADSPYTGASVMVYAHADAAVTIAAGLILFFLLRPLRNLMGGVR